MQEKETLEEIQEDIGDSDIDQQPNNVLARKKKLNLIEQTLLKQSTSALEKAGVSNTVFKPYLFTVATQKKWRN
jgi:hypothetical protein